MNILFVTSSTTIYGGGSKSFILMLKGLMSYGIKPLVILPDNKGLFQLLQQDGIACISLRYAYRMSVYPPTQTFKDKVLFIPRLIGRLLINNLATLQLLHITKRFAPDIIHTNVSVTAIGYYVARRLKIPHIWHIREYGDLDFNFFYYPSRHVQLERYKRPHSYTLCITKDIQEYNHLANWHNSRVIYNGIMSSVESHYQKTKKRYFLFAGRIEQAKGISDLIDAYAEYTKKTSFPIPLHIAGRGSSAYMTIIQNKIAQYNIKDNIVFLGMRKDILSLYKEATALIVPSISEGFGRISAEAMFCGCLVVGNDTAGIKEQFSIGKEISGQEIGLRYHTKEELVQHLVDITINPIDKFETMILLGKQVAIQLYSTEQHAQQVYNFYNKIITK